MNVYIHFRTDEVFYLYNICLSVFVPLETDADRLV